MGQPRQIFGANWHHPGFNFFSVSFVPPAPDQGYERTSYLKPAIHHLSREVITLVALCLLYALEAFGRERKDLEHFRQQTLKVGEMQEDGNSRIGRANFVEGCATLRFSVAFGAVLKAANMKGWRKCKWTVT